MKTIRHPLYNIGDVILLNNGFVIKISQIIDISLDTDSSKWVYKTHSFSFMEDYEKTHYITDGLKYKINGHLLEIE